MLSANIVNEGLAPPIVDAKTDDRDGENGTLIKVNPKLKQQKYTKYSWRESCLQPPFPRFKDTTHIHGSQYTQKESTATSAGRQADRQAGRHIPVVAAEAVEGVGLGLNLRLKHRLALRQHPLALFRRRRGLAEPRRHRFVGFLQAGAVCRVARPLLLQHRQVVAEHCLDVVA